MTTLPAWPPRRRYLFINGIRTDVEAHAQNWNYRAERWIEDETDGTADCYAYSVKATTRWLKQDHHVQQCAAVLTGRRRPNDSLIIGAHSNGCEIARRVVVDKGVPVSELHLIAAAVDDDFEKNGINRAVADGLIGRLFVYVSKSDRALKTAKRWHWVRFLSPKFGYGALGLLGPKNVSPETARRMDVLDHPGFDHGTYFDGANFDNTMRSIAGLDRPKGGTPPAEQTAVEWVPAVPPPGEHS